MECTFTHAWCYGRVAATQRDDLLQSSCDEKGAYQLARFANTLQAKDQEGSSQLSLTLAATKTFQRGLLFENICNWYQEHRSLLLNASPLTSHLLASILRSWLMISQLACMCSSVLNAECCLSAYEILGIDTHASYCERTCARLPSRSTREMYMQVLWQMRLSRNGEVKKRTTSCTPCGSCCGTSQRVAQRLENTRT